MLDAVAPLTEIMKLFQSQAEEISSEHIAKAVELELSDSATITITI